MNLLIHVRKFRAIPPPQEQTRISMIQLYRELGYHITIVCTRNILCVLYTTNSYERVWAEIQDLTRQTGFLQV
jgi:hypothetical protein